MKATLGINNIWTITEGEDESPTYYNGDWSIGTFITEQNLDFYQGCVVKYICRYKKKNGLEDLIKAKTYLDQLIKLESHSESKE
jgi:hypothetical protein